MVTGLAVDRANLAELVKVDGQSHQMTQSCFAADGLAAVLETVRVAAAT